MPTTNIEWTPEDGARLRAARERAGLTRDVLAYRSGRSVSTIIDLEAGQRRDGSAVNPRSATLRSIAGAIGDDDDLSALVADRAGDHVPTTDEITAILWRHLTDAIAEIAELAADRDTDGGEL